MGTKCLACSKEFTIVDRVVRVNLEIVRRGEKSGLLGFYEDSQSPDDERIHFTYSCIEKYFSPADNPFMYDSIAAEVRKEIYEDEKSREDDIPLADPDDPPYCLWCKREDTVWMQIQRDMYIYNCLACRRLWDHNEEELTFDPQRGYVTVEG